MAYFPFLINLTDKIGLIVGAGSVALQKAIQLRSFGLKLRVVAPTPLREFRALDCVDLLERPFSDDDIATDVDFVVAATDSRTLNRHIAQRCQDAKIPVNCVDDPDASSFIFPAIVKRDDLVVAISTNGKAPSLAVRIKEWIESLIPSEFGRVVKNLVTTRAIMKERKLACSARKRLLRNILDIAVHVDSHLSTQRLEELIDSECEGKLSTGRVDFIGAGAGDKSLLTVRALRRLANCDAVLYDDLIDKSLLDDLSEDVVKIAVGKRAGLPSARQGDICQKMIDLARQGLHVVRLKGGDPLLFGRAVEEAQALQEAQIPFTWTPGVSSAFYIPMEAGVPLTCRNLSRSVHIATAHTVQSDLFEQLPIFARLNGTLVVLMGLSVIDKIVASLIEGGKSKNTPVAVIAGGNAPVKYVVRGRLDDIVQKCEEQNVSPPAVIVIGEVAGFDLNSPDCKIDNLIVSQRQS
ncbi:MAG: uroporphyrinogen-III C-methyltransferase [Planctomycetia bacterium]|nr:uroporphyrinogen-III C-methyltransferase [Planctomycetia bacterium]